MPNFHKLSASVWAAAVLIVLSTYSTIWAQEKISPAVELSEGFSERFKISKKGEYRCPLELDGRIELGDSKKLEELFREFAADNPFDADYFRDAGYEDHEIYTEFWSEYGFKFLIGENDEVRLLNQDGLNFCLNSPGGNFSEAIKIYDLFKSIGIGTVVPDHSQCLSACAIIFLAGNFQHQTTMGGNLITAVDRAIYANGTLGVHAPSIDVQIKEDLTPEEVSSEISRAYDTAVSQNAKLINRLSDNELPVLRKILSTPPSSMYIFDTVEKTLEIEMEVIGARVPTEIGPENVIAACENAAKAFVYVSSKYEPLGQPRNQGVWHWQCEPRATWKPARLDPGKIEIVTTQGELIVGGTTIPALNCREPERTNYCVVVFTPEAVLGVTGQIRLSAGIWQSQPDIPLWRLPQSRNEPNFVQPFFTWDGGTHLAYPATSSLSRLAK